MFLTCTMEKLLKNMSQPSSKLFGAFQVWFMDLVTRLHRTSKESDFWPLNDGFSPKRAVNVLFRYCIRWILVGQWNYQISYIVNGINPIESGIFWFSSLANIFCAQRHYRISVGFWSYCDAKKSITWKFRIALANLLILYLLSDLWLCFNNFWFPLNWYFSSIVKQHTT